LRDPAAGRGRVEALPVSPIESQGFGTRNALSETLGAVHAAFSAAVILSTATPVPSGDS
jgi:hypothetical protein